MADWQPIETVPRDGSEIILLIGETIPDHYNVRSGSFIGGDESEYLGWREFAKYGGWLIWNNDCDWDVIDVSEPNGWMPLPPPPNKAED